MSKSNESQDLKADVPKVRKLIGQEPRSMSLYSALSSGGVCSCLAIPSRRPVYSPSSLTDAR